MNCVVKSFDVGPTFADALVSDGARLHDVLFCETHAALVRA